MKSNFLGHADKLAKRISKISDQELLVKIAKEAELIKIKCAAVQNIVLQEHLEEYVGHQNYLVRLAALNNLRVPGILAELAINDTDSDVRAAAVKHIDDKAILYKVVKGDAFEKLRLAALNNIQDPGVLAEVATNDSHWEVRQAAVRSVKDQGVLCRIAERDSSTKVRIAAITKVNDIKTLLRIANAAEGEVKEAAEKRKLKLLAQLIGFEVISSNGKVNWPDRIALFADHAEFSNRGRVFKTIPYTQYGVGKFVYYSWWCTDGSSGGTAVNELRLVAEDLNKRAEGIYNIWDKNREIVDRISSEAEMHTFHLQTIYLDRKDV